MEKIDWRKQIEEIINNQAYKMSEEGEIKWRSGMDAGSEPPVFIGMHIADIINSLLIQEEDERQAYEAEQDFNDNVH